MNDAICTGCGHKASEMPEYDKNNPVEEDGTYADGKFVCTGCYMNLILQGLDIGTPLEIQENARLWSHGKGNVEANNVMEVK